MLILRLASAGLMLPHGWRKLMKIIEGDFGFPDPIGIGESPSLILATFAEFLCPVMIVIGFRTRLAAIPPAFTMAVAAIIHHSGDPWGDKELPFLYLFTFICISLLGPGKYSIDGK